MKNDIKIGKHIIGDNHPTYFIADIAANHDGDIERAKSLIKLAKESGADGGKGSDDEDV
jgi:N-acetylneuraminate synthase